MKNRWMLALGAALYAAVYFATALGSFRWLSPPGYDALVWIPTGLAIALVVKFGPRAAPLLFVCACLSNYVVGRYFSAAIAVAVGNSLEALTAWWIVTRIPGFQSALRTPRDVLGLAFASCAGAAVSATIGKTAMFLIDGVPWSGFPLAWANWWQGNVVGAFVIAPALLAWSEPPRTRWTRIRVLEAAALLTSIVAISTGLSQVWIRPGPWLPGISLMLFPLFAWAAVRFDVQGAASALLVTVLLAVWLVARGADAGRLPSLEFVRWQLYAVSTGLALSTLLVAAAFSDRSRALAALRYSEQRLQYVIEATHDGIWDWDLRDNTAYCSDRMFQLMGLEPGLVQPSYAEFISRVHPDDQTRIAATAQEHRRRGGVNSAEARIVLPTGELSWFHIRGVAVPDEHGQTTRIVGAMSDITSRKEAETQLRQANEALEERVALRTRELIEANRRLANEMVQRQQAEQWLQMAVESSRTGLWEWDIAAQRVQLSALWKKQVGYEPHELPDEVGSFLERVHTDDLESTLAHLRRYFAEHNQRYENLLRVRHRDGRYLWFLARGEISYDAAGKPRPNVGRAHRHYPTESARGTAPTAFRGTLGEPPPIATKRRTISPLGGNLARRRVHPEPRRRRLRQHGGSQDLRLRRSFRADRALRARFPFTRSTVAGDGMDGLPA